MAVDERLRRELDRAGRPADPSGVYEHLIRRRERRRVLRRVQVSVLTVVVIAGSVAGIYGLTRVFEPTGRTPGVDPSPVPVTHENGLITFVVDGELHAMYPDGSGDRVIPTPSDGVRSAVWSADGNRLALVTVERGELGLQSLWVTERDGSNATKIATGMFVISPSWSPDGATIAYATLVGRQAEIHLAAPDGSSDRVIYGELGLGLFPIYRLGISPDGRTILFDRRLDSGASIVAMNIDGTNIRPLTSTGTDFDPSWSPDGLRIAFTRVDTEARPSPTTDIFVMNADGSDVRRLTDGGGEGVNGSPEWSPDGTKIAYLAGLDERALVIMNADGTDPVELTGIDAGLVSWQPIPASDTPPTDEPSPSESPAPVEGIGLGFPVCNVSSIRAPFANPGETATAFVATRRGDTGGCPPPEDALNVVALDVDADGLADASYGPIECTLECRTFSAPDLDADGSAELLIVHSGGSVLGLGLFDLGVRDGALVIEPVTIATPGDPAGGFEPGANARLLLGGDEFFLYALACGDPEMRHGPGMVVTAAESLPHDAPDARWHAHRTTFALVDGSLRVMDVGDFTEPAGFDPPSFQSGETLCGSNLGP